MAEELYPERSVFLVRAKDEDVRGDGILSEEGLGGVLAERSGDHGFILSMGNRDYRDRWLAVAREHRLRAESVVHPRAVIARGARVGPGCYVAANAVVSNDAILAGHCLINYNVVVGHDARLGEHVIVNPGASLGGHASLGEHVLVGANAFVSQGITIGERCSVDALTYVDRDLAADSLLTSRSMRTMSRMEQKREAPRRRDPDRRDLLLSVINRVRENNNQDPVLSIQDQTSLRSDLGMDSLALAELTVNLEVEFGIDVFQSGLVSTVAEVESRLGFLGESRMRILSREGAKARRKSKEEKIGSRLILNPGMEDHGSHG